MLSNKYMSLMWKSQIKPLSRAKIMNLATIRRIAKRVSKPSSNNDRWYFATLAQLQTSFPVWQEWWFATVWQEPTWPTVFYQRDTTADAWVFNWPTWSYIWLNDTTDVNYTGKAGYVPMVDSLETWLTLTKLNPFWNLIWEIINADTNPAFPLNPAEWDARIITTTEWTVWWISVEINDTLVYTASWRIVMQGNLWKETKEEFTWLTIAPLTDFTITLSKKMFSWSNFEVFINWQNLIESSIVSSASDSITMNVPYNIIPSMVIKVLYKY